MSAKDITLVPEIASRINHAVAEAEASAKSAVAFALEAGRLLNEAKESVGHGAWADWLKDHITLAPRTCRAYMRLAKQYAALVPEDRQRVAEMPVREAINAITASATAPASTSNKRLRVTESSLDRHTKQLTDAAAVLRKLAKRLVIARESDLERARKVLTQALESLNEIGGDHA